MVNLKSLSDVDIGGEDVKNYVQEDKGRIALVDSVFAVILMSSYKGRRKGGEYFCIGNFAKML